ncbi:hypothetical protein BX667DRAFT_508181 [Coemansia mojavensis]|nr:hypothetical protein BX667DRAFT_508181 [Coemansia mojavensis]
MEHCQTIKNQSNFVSTALVRANKRALIAGLLVVFTLTYLLALEGGDLEHVKNHLSSIGAYVLISVMSLTGVTVMLYASRMRTSTRRGTVLLILIIFTALYAYDHGERFERHGFYNLLVFLAIYIPLNLVLALLYALWCKIDNFARYFIVAAAIGSIAITALLVHYRQVFDFGMRHRFEYIPGECIWSGRNIPFIDLLPAGTQNFWAGSKYCKQQAQNIDAAINPDGTLHVKCEDPNADITVDILPDTRVWPLRDKDVWTNYNTNVINRTIKAQYPVKLGDATQAVVVHCGSSSTLVTRVSPSVAKLSKHTLPSTGTLANLDSASEAHGRPNVIYLMFDAVSRRHFIRRLPQSAKVFSAIHKPGVNRITELFRYHSVGFSTENNTKAMYLGEIFPSDPSALPIWAYFKDKGYVTARVDTGCEDWVKEYHKKTSNAFVSERALDYEFTAPFCLPECFPESGNPFGNFKGPYSIVSRCLYGRYLHEWAFDYLYKLRQEMRLHNTSGKGKHRPYMISITFMEGHEGTGEVLSTVDDALAAFLQDMHESGELNNTVLIVGGDHGLHMGLNFAYLQNGRIEHQNPFFAMSVPEWLYEFADKYHQTHTSEQEHPLLLNEQRLTTPFELHHTFRVLAEWPQVNHDSWKRSLLYPQKRGRLCSEAGIGEGYCMCRPS